MQAKLGKMVEKREERMSDGVLMLILGALLVVFGAWFLILVLSIIAIKAFYENVWKRR